MLNKKYILKNLKIELVVFFCGAILMSLEIIGGRLFMPDYGGTVFVWGSIIAVTLGGLSLGYYIGGWLADKMSRESVLASILVVASLLIMIIPITYPNIVSLLYVLPSNISLLISVLSMFLLPSVLLGTISPYAIKLRATKLERIGKTSGNLYALSTLGSVIGTFFTTFVLIQTVSLTKIFIGLGILLLLLAIILSRRLCFPALIIMVVMILVIYPIFNKIDVLFSANSLSSNELEPYQPNIDFIENLSKFEDENIDIALETHYGTVEVKSHGNIRSLYINGGVMGEIDLENKFKTVRGWEYIDLFEQAVLIEPVDNVLVLGVGAGLLPTRLSEKHGIHVDAVDINDKVLDVAVEYFGLIPKKNLNLYHSDARMFLKYSNKKYDVIVMDIFKYTNDIHNIPFHLTTKEYFLLIKEHLKEGGLFVLMVTEEDLFKSEIKTLESVFESIYTFKFGCLVAISADKIINLEKISKELLETSYEVDTNKSQVLTDDFTPIRPIRGIEFR